MGSEKDFKKQQPRFTSDDDEQLIELVAGHDILWKVSAPDFKNNLKKERIWIEIGNTLNKSGKSNCLY